MVTANPLRFRAPNGAIANGYPATLLVDLCAVVLSARDKGLLQKQQAHLAQRADILIRGFATVRIIALVDQATGYQKIRTQRAPAAILERFIAEERRPWTRTFSPEFYEEISRLKGWSAPDGVKRPSVIGTYTSDIIYELRAPGVLDELKRINSPISPVRRRRKHFQWLTGDMGHPKLKEHLIDVMALMRAAPNWGAFKRTLQRSYPKLNEQVSLALGDDD